MIGVREYETKDGASPYARWFARLNAQAAAKVTVAITRLGQGNFSNVEGVGKGVFEYKIHYGPGYRIYFGKDGDKLIILIGGGTKKRQSKAVADSQDRWKDYKQRKRKGVK